MALLNCTGQLRELGATLEDGGEDGQDLVTCSLLLL